MSATNLSKDDISQCILEQVPVLVSVQETSVVMVVQEVPQNRNILENLLVGRDTVVNALHGPLLLKSVGELVEHWVVKGGGEGTLVPRDVIWVPVEDFAYGIDPCGLSVLGPKVLGDFWDSVDPDAIKVVGLDCVSDPLLQSRTNKGI